jgi:hypothetical protein
MDIFEKINARMEHYQKLNQQLLCSETGISVPTISRALRGMKVLPATRSVLETWFKDNAHRFPLPESEVGNAETAAEAAKDSL